MDVCQNSLSQCVECNLCSPKAMNSNRVWYKVTDAKKRSCYSTGIKVQYDIDQVTLPSIPGSKLFIFDSHANATLFANGMLNFRIFECRATGVIPCLTGIPGSNTCSPTNSYNFREFWRLYNKSLPRRVNLTIVGGLSEVDPPYGTYLADAVKLIRELSTLHHGV